MSFFTRFLSGSSPATMDQANSKVLQLINENKVVLFTKSWCSYCAQSKRTLDKLGAEYAFFDLDKMPDGHLLQDALEELTGQRTVPNNFISAKHVGGNSDLQNLQRQGKLEKMLLDAGAVKA